MKNKEWLNVNEYRYFPFTEELPVLKTDYILDINFLVTTDYELPLKVSQIRILNNLFTLVIRDNLNSFVGVFSSLSTSMIPAANGCSGIITYSDKTPSFEQEALYETDIKIELCTVRLTTPQNVSYFSINDTHLTGDIIIKEDTGYTLEVNEIDSNTDELVINSTNQYLPKCSSDSPITAINEVTPDSNGNINLIPISSHINMENLDNKRILLSSDLNSVDFDSHSLTDAMGPIGEPGIAGRDGINGRNASLPVPTIQPYGGGFLYPENRFVTKAIDADIIVKLQENFLAYSTTSKDMWENIKPEVRAALYVKKQLPEIPLGVCTTTDSIYIYEAAGYLSTNGERVKIADSISSFSASDENYAFIEGDILRFRSGESYQMPDLYKVKYINNDLHIIFSNGRYQIWDKIIYQLHDSRKMLDTNGEWIIGEQGMLYRIVEFPKDYSNNIGIYEDLLSIHGNYIVGNGGVILRYVNNRFTRIPSPTNKNWKSVYSDSFGAWIFGGY